MPHLKKRYTVAVAHTGQAALQCYDHQAPDVMVVDTTAMRTSGERLCLILKNTWQDTPLIYIKNQPAPEDQTSVADRLLYHPFTYRKLCNWINRYTNITRAEDIVRVGGFHLNLSQSLLTSPCGEQKLTPKLVKMMHIFMQHPHEIIERRQLIKEVWETDYMGDTRTLDVHIRWIREAVEQNPSKPQWIQTVRGKGYIFKPT